MVRSYLPQEFFDPASRPFPWTGMDQHPSGSRPDEQVANLDYVVTKVPLLLGDTAEPVATHVAYVASSRSTPSVRKPIAITSADYTAVLPEDDGAILTQYFPRPADAMGVMGGGIGLWALFHVGRMAIYGDELDLNFLYASPKNAQGAVMLRLQPLRIVCSNAITMSSRTAVETYRAVHDAHVKERVSLWLERLMAQVPLRQRMLQEEFTLLSDTRVPDDLARRILADVYPEPLPPVQDAPDDIMRERMESWEHRRQRIQQRRNTAFDLYQGQGTGLDVPACKGTAFGLLNAVTELEDWSRSHTAKTRSDSALFGQRSSYKARTFTILLDLARSV